ncbi:hypothetical protein FB451DRAFT_1568112 [Mycena latifolia]|nr:hypothetical protein FB451DRAFT_1568112 [Mycena latifolia]
MPHSSSPTPSSSPGRPLDELLALTQQLTPSKSPRTVRRCLERIHKITGITPGGIVTAGILAIWLLSADTQLVQVGDETTIDYGLRHRLYIRRIREGLRDKKAWALGLIEYWNRILFPNADKSSDRGAAGDELVEDEEELDDIFAQAPSAPLSAGRRRRPTPPPASPDILAFPVFPTSALPPVVCEPAASPDILAFPAFPTSALAPLVYEFSATAPLIITIIAHCIPDIHSHSCLSRAAPTGATCGRKGAIFLTIACSPEPLSQRREARAVKCSVAVIIICIIK